LPGKIEQHQGDVIAVHVQTEGEAAIGIDYQARGWLTARAYHPARRLNQSNLEKPAGDIGDCRRG